MEEILFFRVLFFAKNRIFRRERMADRAKKQKKQKVLFSVHFFFIK